MVGSPNFSLLRGKFAFTFAAACAISPVIGISDVDTYGVRRTGAPSFHATTSGL